MSAIGIDLGTSYSSLARLDEQGRPQVLPNAEGGLRTPSAVYFGPEGVLVGATALREGRENPDWLVEHAKRYLGSKNAWEIRGVLYSPVDVAAFLLRKLRTDAEKQIGPLGPVVITVPVHFTLHQRHLVMEAGKQAGLEVVDLVNEPVAAALDFIMGDQGIAFSSLAGDQTILVFDLGGGTFDLALVRYGEEKVQVLAGGGDLLLGGIDWNQALIDDLAIRFEKKHGIDLRKNRRFLRQLVEKTEMAKRLLSDPTKPVTTIGLRYEKESETFPIARDEFEGMTLDLVARTRSLMEGLMASAGLHWHQLDQVLPVGGSTRMPMIRHLLDEICRGFMPASFKPNYALSPDLAVARGAAIYAGLRDGGAATAGALPRVRNQRGLGLGVRGDGGRMVNQVLIPPGTPLPASARVVVASVSENQPRIALKVVEGDEEDYSAEQVVMRCVLGDLPKGLPIDSLFDVEMTYEPSGLLSVIAKHRDSGRLATTSIVRAE